MMPDFLDSFDTCEIVKPFDWSVVKAFNVATGIDESTNGLIVSSKVSSFDFSLEIKLTNNVVSNHTNGIAAAKSVRLSIGTL